MVIINLAEEEKELLKEYFTSSPFQLIRLKAQAIVMRNKWISSFRYCQNNIVALFVRFCWSWKTKGMHIDQNVRNLNNLIHSSQTSGSLTRSKSKAGTAGLPFSCLTSVTSLR